MEAAGHSQSKEVMSVFRPLRCLNSKPVAPLLAPSSRWFHSSHPRSRARKSGGGRNRAILKSEDIKPYSEEEKKHLSQRYTPAQLAAIEAGEAAIDPEDLATQAILRNDQSVLDYYDDLSSIHPVVDKPVPAPEENYDPDLRFKDEDEIADDFTTFIENATDETTDLDFQDFQENMRVTVGKEEAERNPHHSLAPDIPKLDILKPRSLEDGDDIDPAIKRSMRQTGLTHDEIRKLRFKILVSHRVVNQTRMGKIQSIYYLAVVGNQKGLLGIGEGKSTEVGEGSIQARLQAIKNMRPIPRYEDRTIYGDVKGKVGATELELMTRPPGSYPISYVAIKC